jgi:hypothetical protein
MAFTEDLAEFLSTDDFAVAATYNGATTVNGIFDNDYINDSAMESSRPRFVCKQSDVPAVAHGDTLVVSAVTYHVASVEPDGTGLVTLVLEKQ